MLAPLNRLTCALVLSFLSTALAEESLNPYILRFRPTIQRVSTSDAYGYELSSDQLLANQTTLANLIGKLTRSENGRLSSKAIINLYKTAENFYVVQGLVGPIINESDNKAIGEIRKQLHLAALSAMVVNRVANERLGIFDLDYPINESQWSADNAFRFALYTDNQKIDGPTLVKTYTEELRKITDLEPQRLGLFPVPFEIVSSDWRKYTLASTIDLHIPERIDTLLKDPESSLIKVKHASEQQQALETLASFTWLKLSADKKVNSTSMSPAWQYPFFNIPASAPAYAFGTSLYYWHLYNASQEDLTKQAEDLIKSIDSGNGLLMGPQKAGVIAQLTPADQTNVLHFLYGDELYPHDLERAFATLQCALQLIDPQTTVSDEMKVFKPLMDLERRHQLVVLSDEELLAFSKKLFKKMTTKLLLLNMTSTATKAQENWVTPESHTNTHLIAVDPSGKLTDLRLSNDLLDPLQFASIFEIRQTLPHTYPEIFNTFAKQNPKHASIFTLLSQIYESEIKMMPAPEEIEAQNTAHTRVEETTKALLALTQLKQQIIDSPFALRDWKKAPLPVPTDEKMESLLNLYLQRALSKASQGDSYVPILERCFKDSEMNHYTLLSPMWMSRLDNIKDVKAILKVFVREGKINSAVLSAALEQQLAFLPGIANLYTIQSDGKKNESFLLVRTIPGAGEIRLHLQANPKGFEVIDPVSYDAIEDQELISALMNQNPEDQKKSSNQSLFSPIAQKDKLSLKEARREMSEIIKDHVAKMFKADTTVWYTENENPADWQNKEFEFAEHFIKQYVSDWSTGSLPFAPISKEQQEDRESISEEIVKLLLDDYVTLKAIDLQERIVNREKALADLFEMFNEIFALEIAFAYESELQQKHFTQAGLISFLQMLNNLPTFQEQTEITAVPYTINSAESLDPILSPLVRITSITGASLQNYPSPWFDKWSMEIAKKDTQDDSSSDHTGIHSINVNLSVYDKAANLISLGSLPIDIQKLISPKWEKEHHKKAAQLAVIQVQDLKEELVYLNEDAAKIVVDIKDRADQLNFTLNKTSQDLDDVIAERTTLNQPFKEIQTDIDNIKQQSSNLDESINKIDASAKELSIEKRQAEKLTHEACGHLSKISKAKTDAERNQLLAQLSEKKLQLQELHKQSIQVLSIASENADKIAKVAKGLHSLQHEIEGIRKKLSIEDFSLRQIKKQLHLTADDIFDYEQAQKVIINHQSASTALIDHANKIQKSIKEQTPEISQLIHDMTLLAENYKSFNESIRTALQETMQQQARCLEKLTNSDHRLQEGYAKIDDLLRALHENNAIHEIDQFAEKAAVSKFSADLLWDSINDQLHNVERCEALGHETVRALKQAPMPNVKGFSINDATNKLVELKLKVNRVAGHPAPNDELTYKVESQTPEPGTLVKPGDVVTIVIYGDHRISLPDFRGMSSKEATEKLKSMDLKVKIVGGNPAPEEALSYKVQFQMPRAGEQVKSGDTIILTLYSQFSGEQSNTKKSP